MAGRLKRRLKSVHIRSPAVERLAKLDWGDRVRLFTSIMERLDPASATNLHTVQRVYEDRKPLLQAQPQAVREQAEAEFRHAWASLLLESMRTVRGKAYPMNAATFTKPSAVADVMRFMHWLLDEVEQRGVSAHTPASSTVSTPARHEQQKHHEEQERSGSAGVGSHGGDVSNEGRKQRQHRHCSSRPASHKRPPRAPQLHTRSQPHVASEDTADARSSRRQHHHHPDPPSLHHPDSPSLPHHHSDHQHHHHHHHRHRQRTPRQRRRSALDEDLLLQRVEMYKQQNLALQEQVVQLLRLLRHVQSREDQMQSLENELDHMSASTTAAVMMTAVHRMQRVVAEMRALDTKSPPTVYWTPPTHTQGRVKLQKKHIHVHAPAQPAAATDASADGDHNDDGATASVLQMCSGKLDHLNLQHISRLEEEVVRARVWISRAAAEIGCHEYVRTRDGNEGGDGSGSGDDDDDGDGGDGGGDGDISDEGDSDVVARCLRQLDSTAHALSSTAMLVPAAHRPKLARIRRPRVCVRDIEAAATRAHAHRSSTMAHSPLYACRHDDVPTRERPSGPRSGNDSGGGSEASGLLLERFLHFGIGSEDTRAANIYVDVPAYYFLFPSLEEWHKHIATISPKEYEQVVDSVLWHANYQQLCDHVSIAHLKTANAILSHALHAQERATCDAMTAMVDTVSTAVLQLRKEIALPLKDVLEALPTLQEEAPQVVAALDDLIQRTLLPTASTHTGAATAHQYGIARVEEQVQRIWRKLRPSIDKALHLARQSSLWLRVANGSHSSSSSRQQLGTFHQHGSVGVRRGGLLGTGTWCCSCGGGQRRHYGVMDTAISAVEQGLVFVRSTTGLPWWASVCAVGAAMRLGVLLPPAIKSEEYRSRIELLGPTLREWADALRFKVYAECRRQGKKQEEADHLLKKEMKAKQKEIFDAKGLERWRILGVGFAPIPAWLLMSLGVRQVCVAPSEPSAWTELLSSEGLPWCLDLTAQDTTLALPIAVCLSNLISVQLTYLLRPRPGQPPHLKAPPAPQQRQQHQGQQHADSLPTTPASPTATTTATPTATTTTPTAAPTSAKAPTDSKQQPARPLPAKAGEPQFPVLLTSIAVLMLPIYAALPSGLVLYWFVSSASTVVQSITLRHPGLRRALRLPRVPSETSAPLAVAWGNARSDWGQFWAEVREKNFSSRSEKQS
ncbi:hypothetical protein PTSG_00956 [Salpingoeca rosetta]|uniref:Uncharacterized protein n=1 Tax=Salpingoeca rosetta (strain ATCC 50818 / BSB-021) TaxID=946362 RepID=F2TXZ5_SALR5|nr:uncharacterized protein PTSG_00956 [Salpingoeca rosetta]EGD76254.1 hypothetical protein PTSG_00956 [Salpingoeca rosetta]|eukprot:XP_004998429.1 hypothetical protein PTSG_00956 [Salpingoeca rosetta]